MQIAAGSHRTLYFTHDEPASLLSRFSDAYVRSTHPVHTLTGRRGGGFLFDSNALHRAQTAGAVSRTAVVLEFHPHGKVPRLARGRYSNPCPSSERPAAGDARGRRRLAGASAWVNGTPGFPLYPPEVG